MAVARGAAVGRAVCLFGKKHQFYRLSLNDEQAAKEIRRFRAAIRLAGMRLKRINPRQTEGKTTILDVQQLILVDKSLRSRIEQVITEQNVNAEWAVKTVTDQYLSAYKEIQDTYLRERYVDLEDVTERILDALIGSAPNLEFISPNSVIVATELKPSTLAEIAAHKPLAIVTESGGWTSHTFILARELGLPAVAGLKSVFRRIKPGDEVAVDGHTGVVTIFPSAGVKKAIRTAQYRSISDKEPEFTPPAQKLQTLDRREITIRANTDINLDYEEARRKGARGFGLYRSELLYTRQHGIPGESFQRNAYKKAVRATGKDGVKVRTFDLSAEQIFSGSDTTESNPALGLRGVRLSLTQKRAFTAQLRALLEAAHHGKLDILLPMVSDLEELRRVKKLLQSERRKLLKSGRKCGSPRVGAMIEVPAAVLMADEIAAETDFLALGTNDLVQYTLAVDRDNEAVADWFRTLHPAVLRAIKKVAEAAEKNAKPLIVCGEMAGSPVYAAILIGLGITELSMNVSCIARVWRAVSQIAFEEAQEVAAKLLVARTASEAEAIARQEFSAKWPTVFPAPQLP